MRRREEARTEGAADGTKGDLPAKRHGDKDGAALCQNIGRRPICKFFRPARLFLLPERTDPGRAQSFFLRPAAGVQSKLFGARIEITAEIVHIPGKKR